MLHSIFMYRRRAAITPALGGGTGDGLSPARPAEQPRPASPRSSGSRLRVATTASSRTLLSKLTAKVPISRDYRDAAAQRLKISVAPALPRWWPPSRCWASRTRLQLLTDCLKPCASSHSCSSFPDLILFGHDQGGFAAPVTAIVPTRVVVGLSKLLLTNAIMLPRLHMPATARAAGTVFTHDDIFLFLLTHELAPLLYQPLSDVLDRACWFAQVSRSSRAYTTRRPNLR